MVVIKAHEGSVNDLKFDVSNDWFASCGSDNLIKVWSFPNPELLLTYTGHKLSVRALEISTQLAYMFSGSEDKNIICWDLETNKPIRNYHGHLSGVYSLALHPSIPYLLASGSRDSSVRVWDVRTRLPIYVLNHDGAVNCLKFQNDEPQLISGSQDRTVKFWDLKTGKPTNTLTTMQNSVRCLALSELEYTFVAGAKMISQFAFPNGDLLGEFGQDEVVNTMSIVNNSVYAGYDSGKLITYDYTSGEVTKETLTKSGVMSSCVDMSHTRLVTGHLDSTIKLWELDQE